MVELAGTYAAETFVRNLPGHVHEVPRSTIDLPGGALPVVAVPGTNGLSVVSNIPAVVVRREPDRLVELFRGWLDQHEASSASLENASGRAADLGPLSYLGLVFVGDGRAPAATLEEALHGAFDDVQAVDDTTLLVTTSDGWRLRMTWRDATTDEEVGEMAADAPAADRDMDHFNDYAVGVGVIESTHGSTSHWDLGPG